MGGHKFTSRPRISRTRPIYR